MTTRNKAAAKKAKDEKVKKPKAAKATAKKAASKKPKAASKPAAKKPAANKAGSKPAGKAPKAASKTVSGKKGAAKAADTLKKTIKTGKTKDNKKSAHSGNTEKKTGKTGIPNAQLKASKKPSKTEAKKRKDRDWKRRVEAAKKPSKTEAKKSGKVRIPPERMAALTISDFVNRSKNMVRGNANAAPKPRPKVLHAGTGRLLSKGPSASRIKRIRGLFKAAMGSSPLRRRGDNLESLGNRRRYGTETTIGFTGRDGVRRMKQAVRRRMGKNAYTNFGIRQRIGQRNTELQDQRYERRTGRHDYRTPMTAGKLRRIAAKHGVAHAVTPALLKKHKLDRGESWVGMGGNRLPPKPKSASAKFASARSQMIKIATKRSKLSNRQSISGRSV